MARIDKSIIAPAHVAPVLPKAAAKAASIKLAEACRAVAAAGVDLPEARPGADMGRVKAALAAATAAVESYEAAIKALE